MTSAMAAEVAARWRRLYHGSSNSLEEVPPHPQQPPHRFLVQLRSAEHVCVPFTGFFEEMP